MAFEVRGAAFINGGCEKDAGPLLASSVIRLTMLYPPQLTRRDAATPAVHLFRKTCVALI